jgi:hypothetical protein
MRFQRLVDPPLDKQANECLVTAAVSVMCDVPSGLRKACEDVSDDWFNHESPLDPGDGPCEDGAWSCVEWREKMSDFAAKYKIPPEVDRFVETGFLEFLSENEAEQTIKFDIPSIAWTDDQDRDTTLVWIHPDFNEQFCHYYDSKPGDLANFYVFKETTDSGDDWLDIANIDDLLSWLEERKESRTR